MNMYKKPLRYGAMVLMAALIQGCTIYWGGLVDNESDVNIRLIGNDAKKTSWNVNANEEVKISWKFSCLEVVEAGKSAYFDADPKSVPKGALRSGGMTPTVYTVYRDHRMYYLLENGDVQPLTKVNDCSK